MRRIAAALVLCCPVFGIDLIHKGVRTPGAFSDTCAGLQAALNAAVGGDILELQNGLTGDSPYYDCGTRTVTVPVRSDQNPPSATADDYVTVRPVTHRNLPDGNTRICPPGSLAATGNGAAQYVPCTPNVSASDLAIVRWRFGFTTGFQGAKSAHHWRFVGLELQGSSDVGWSALMAFNQASYGCTATDPCNLERRNHDIEIDRCYLHGYLDINGPATGITVVGHNIAIRNSDLEEIKASTQEGRPIYINTGPGPYAIENNFIAGSAQGIMTAGTKSYIAGTAPARTRVTGNYITRDSRWWRMTAASAPAGACSANGRWVKNTASGACYQCQSNTWRAAPCPVYGLYESWIKNLLEYKAMQGSLIEGNVFDNYWISSFGQYFPIIFNASASGNGYRLTFQDITLRYNIIRNSTGGIVFGAPGGGDPYDQMRIEHNVFDTVNQPERNGSLAPPNNAGSMYLFRPDLGAADGGLVFRHNTQVNSTIGAATNTWPFGVYASPTGSTKCRYCRFLDNILDWNYGNNQPGPFSGDSGPDVASITRPGYAYHAWDHSRVSGNVILNSRPSGTYVTAYNNPSCCEGNYLSTGGMAAALVNPTPGGDYRVSASGSACGGESCKGKALDGTDPGADIDTVTALAGQAANGRSNGYSIFRLGGWEAAATSARIYFQAPDATGNCTVGLSKFEAGSTPEGQVTMERSGVAVTAMVTGLEAGTEYSYTVRCGAASRRAQLRTRVQ